MAAPEGKPAAITPLPAPPDADRIVLFGGTFDPPHRAHVRLACAARDWAAGPGAWLVFVPAARSPFKDEAPARDPHRVEMLRIAAEEAPGACVWTDEIDRAARGEPSFWIETLRRARALRPRGSFWFILGSDQAAAFHRWREPREILSLARPVILARAPLTTPDELGAALRDSGAWSADEIARARALLAPTPVLDASATAAREILRARGPDDPRLGVMLHPGVLAYVREHGLYAGR
ncbi:MAG TPA: nicotinate-nicotinamide nucleotide adenylyltransferase [Phycisphaerales bacterium]|nr:nicotinate-nicotinamide nucleotide adenylyltransferase [Phycisphaerales bacterium]